MNSLKDMMIYEVDLSLWRFFINLVFGLILSFLTVLHFKYVAPSVAGKIVIARIIPFIAMTTLVVIMIVKSSLALSLGLVGALSVIRFRTAIKDPIELAYIFLAVAIGIGLGAGQILITATGIIFILFVTLVFRKSLILPESKGIYLEIDSSNEDINSDMIIKTIQNNKLDIELRKVYVRGKNCNIICTLNLQNQKNLNSIIEEIQLIDKDISICIIDTNNIPAV